jgi:hypothetical protein
MALASVLACSSTPPPAHVTDSGTEAETSGGGGGYTFKPLGCGAAGTQAIAAVSGSTVAFVSLSPTTMVQTCNLVVLGMPSMSKAQVWDVCYVAGQPGGTYHSQIVTSQPYLGPSGVGVAFDSAGNPSVAYLGVGATPPSETCGSNDAFVTSLQGGTFSAPVQISNGSGNTTLIASQAGNCVEGVCSTGDVTGWWPSIGIDPSGNAMVAYRDVHFGFAADDFARSDVEFAEGSGGSYQVLTIDVSRGGGDYNRVAFTPAGLPAVLQWNTNNTGNPSPGVYINRQTKPGAFSAQAAAGVWTAQAIYSGQMGMNAGQGELGFAISPIGLYAVAYYDAQSNLLTYTDSMDGTKWSTPTSNIDTIGYTGLYPSLAFDENNDPAIAYYRCNGIGPMSNSCNAATDGLYLARRVGGLWSRSVVTANPNLTDGMYPALAFVKGKAVIAYQQSSYDAVAKTSTVSWWVAEAP